MTSASRNRRGRLRLLSTALLATVVAIGTAGPAAAVTAASPAPAVATATAASGPTVKVIVVLKDQLTTTPADKGHVSRRAAAAHADQGTVLGRLAGPAPTNLKHFTVGNAFSATVTADQEAALAADPAVASVTEDKTIKIAPTSTASPTPSAITPKVKTPAVTGPSTVPASVCSTDPTKPTLEPEALQSMNVRSDDPKAKTAAALGIDGTGVKVAYIADGLDPNNAGFLRKDGTSAVVDYQDFIGDGSTTGGGAEAFGDTSAVVAQGNVLYDLAAYANPAVVTFPGGHCYARIVGVAPGASMVALKAGSELLPNSAILQAIDYAVTVDHVDVLNESFGGDIVTDAGARNTIQVFDEQAVAAGVTVTTSSGDAGVTGTIGSPATSAKVISVGASTDSRAYEQSGYALATRFSNGTWLSNNISALSSAGITEGGRTIDVSAPGEADWAVCDDSGNWSECTNYNGGLSPFQLFGGTSQSAPLTAGVAALVIQAYRKTHGGTSPTPAQVKQFITSTARDLGFSGDVQGTGLVDARAAVEAALTAPTATAPAPAGVSSNIALSTDQLTLTGAPGSARTGSVTVTNVGTAPVTVLPSTRRYAIEDENTQTTTLTSALPTLPYPTTAKPWYYTKLSFDVPAGTDVLNSSIYWASGSVLGNPGPVVRMTLIDPNGAFASNTRPQGGAVPANYGTVLVRRPVAGTWTAVLYTPVTGGFLGTVHFDAQSQRAIPVGSVSPLFTLAPGASRAVKVTLPTALQGGDAAYTLSLGTSTGHQVAVPLIVRTQVATPGGVGHFTGTITGGNARGGAPAQTFSYDFDVRGPHRDLTVTTALPAPGNVLFTALVDPNGEISSASSTVTPDAHLSAAVTNTVALPDVGHWRLVVFVIGPVTGTVLTQSFTGTVRYDAQKVAAANVPLGTTIKAGKTVTATLRVTNPTAAPLYAQVDARVFGRQRVQLAPVFGSNSVPLPVDVTNISGLPAYLVPPDTNSVTVSAASDTPTQVELSSPAFGIDVFGDLTSAQNGNTISTAKVSESTGHVGQGIWTTYVQEIGPFGPAGAPTGTSNLVATAITRPFATGITSSTGDPYLQGIDGTADAGTPLVIQPGQTKTITVSIKSTGTAGHHYTGVLNLVTPPSSPPVNFNGSGDVFAVVPFSYTVG